MGGEGRVKINVYVGEPDEDSEPVVFTEALVVEPTVVSYRANIISHDSIGVNTLASIPDSFGVANIILRQAGVALEQSSNTADGNVMLLKEQNANDDQIIDLSYAYFIYSSELALTRAVSDGNEGRTLSINYIPNLLQLSFIESFDKNPDEGGIPGDPSGNTAGRNRYRLSSNLSGDSISESYKTSLNDTFDENINHTLDFEGVLSDTRYNSMFGVLLAWSKVENKYDMGQLIAHEVAHAMNALHRYGNTDDEWDGLESQQNGMLLGPAGSNLLDYGNPGDLGGTDIDLLQIRILRASPIQNDE